MTLAPAFSQALPSLVGVRTDYTHETNRELLFQLCAALVRDELGNAETWKQAGGSAIRFAQSAISGGIDAKRDKLLTRNVEYHLLVTDALERYGEDVSLRSGKLAVLIECGGSGYYNRENPRLCRGDSRCLTTPGVHPRNSQREPAKHTEGVSGWTSMTA